MRDFIDVTWPKPEIHFDETMNGPNRVYCPYCDTLAHAEFVDTGVGMEQVTAYSCECCHAVEIGLYDMGDATAYEKRVGWYKPTLALVCAAAEAEAEYDEALAQAAEKHSRKELAAAIKDLDRELSGEGAWA